METLPRHSVPRHRWLVILYAATIFASAFLLFQVQPLVSKRILPWFGGSPAVWTTCLLFFQTLLCAGYAGAHFMRQWLRPRQQALLQIGLLFVAVSLLRILPNARWEPQGDGNPVSQIVLMLTASVGLPFLMLSATAPLVQSWFAGTFPGQTPYRLYALSNFGSLLALLTFPFWFERVFDLQQQAAIWSWGFIGYAALCGLAVVPLWNASRHREKELGNGPASALLWRDISLWLLLSAFGSIALLATTNHVCTDVAVVPLLWVVPLALYLVTYIIAFDHPRWHRPVLVAAVTLFAVYGSALVYRSGIGSIELYDCGISGRIAQRALHALAPSSADGKSPEFYVGFRSFLVLNLVAMFGICLLCHGELARRRPDPRHLTVFYFMIAAGGALGAAFVTLVAPGVFKTYFEWRLLMFLGAIVAITLLLNAVFHWAGRWRRARWFLLALLLVPTALILADLVDYLKSSDVDVLHRERNFFGALTIRDRYPEDPSARLHVLQHGVTTHGTQFTNPTRRGLPTTYYSTISGVGRSLDYFRTLPGRGGLRIGAVGLGTGTVAAYVGEGDQVAFYEINPAVPEIATNDAWFTYLKDCRSRDGRYEVKLGDARLTLQRELQRHDAKRYHVLVLDAFSGDAIPVHLLTEEAFAGYLARLATEATDGIDGALAVHISNRYLDLEPVVRGAADHFGLQAVLVHNSRDPEYSVYSADWMILTNNSQLLAALAPHSDPPGDALPPAVLWTDERSNLFDVLK